MPPREDGWLVGGNGIVTEGDFRGVWVTVEHAPTLIGERAKPEKRESNLNGTKILRPAPMACNALGAILLCASSSAQAQSPAAQRGLTIARANCAPCHSIDKVSESPLAIAPTFRTLHLKYPVEDLRRPLAEGIIANHPTMPQFRFEADQIEDLIAFLKTLER